MSTAAPHFNALTGMRGLAAWYVVLFHARAALTHTLPPWAMAVADKGYLAVDLFFILSGFVLWHTYGEKLRGMGRVETARFLWRRFARIWPLHGVILSAFVGLAALLEITGRDTAMYPWDELPLHYLLLQNWGFTPLLVWNVPAWSISCEIAASLLFPFVVALAPWGRLQTTTLVVLAVGLLVVIWLFFTFQGGGSMTYDVPRSGLFRCLSEFWLGNVLRLLWGRWAYIPNIALVGWLVLAVIAGSGIGLGLSESAFLPACFAALIFTLALGGGGVARLLGSRVLLYLGEISYSTYLVHFLLFVLFKIAFVQGVPEIGYGPLGAYLVLVLVASVVLYHGVEKPAQRWLNGLVSKPVALLPVSAE